jgi:hypothetical protein
MATATITGTFASDSHHAVAKAVDRWLRSQVETERNNPPEPWFEFGGGWRAVDIRFRTCCEHDRDFTDEIRRNSDHYVQEQELFGFFTTGLAAVESFFYAMYAFGWMLNRGKDGAFDLIDGRENDVTPETTRKAFRKEYGTSDPIVIAQESVLTDTSWTEWKTIRNVLAHRTVPPRRLHISASDGGTIAPPDHFRQESRLKVLGPLDESTTRKRREWLAKTLERLLKTAESFAQEHVP